MAIASADLAFGTHEPCDRGRVGKRGSCCADRRDDGNHVEGGFVWARFDCNGEGCNRLESLGDAQGLALTRGFLTA